MKRILFLLALLLSGVFVFTSCSKNSEEGEISNDPSSPNYYAGVKEKFSAHIEEVYPMENSFLETDFTNYRRKKGVSTVKVENYCKDCTGVYRILDQNSKFHLSVTFMNEYDKEDQLSFLYPIKENTLYAIKNTDCLRINHNGKEYKFNAVGPIYTIKNTGEKPKITYWEYLYVSYFEAMNNPYCAKGIGIGFKIVK